MNGEKASQPAQTNPRRAAKLEHYLNQGKVITHTVRTVEKDGRRVSTLGSIRRTADKGYIVGIDLYLTGVDIGRLREEEFRFDTLEEAKEFLASETGILFHQMQG